MAKTNNSLTMSPVRLRRMIYAALYLALALVLPFVTGQIPEIGRKLCPMHLPVLLCGFMCGFPYGAAVGFIAPVLRSALFSMPPMFPDAVAMTFELATYGGIAGLLHKLLPSKALYTYLTLIIAMIAGRLVWGTVRLLLTLVDANEFTWGVFLARAVVEAIPGIILQIAVIPPLVIVMQKAGLSLIKLKAEA